MLHTLPATSLSHPATSLSHFQHQYQPKMASLGVTMGSHNWVCTVDQAGSHTHTHSATLAHVTDSVGPCRWLTYHTIMSSHISHFHSLSYSYTSCRSCALCSLWRERERKHKTQKHITKRHAHSYDMLRTNRSSFQRFLGLINCLILLVTARNREATYSQRKAGSKKAVRKTT
jgi:hypothetical protein